MYGGVGIGVVIVVLVFRIVVFMRLQEILEPVVLLGGVVHHQIQNDLYATLMAQRDQLLQVFLGAELGIHPVVIGGIVLVVGGGGENGTEPDALHAQTDAGVGIAVVEVVKAVDDAPQVADAVAVGIGEGAYKDLIVNSCVAGRTHAHHSRVINDGLVACFIQIVSAAGVFDLGGLGRLRGTARGEKQQRRKKQRQKSFHNMNPPFSKYSITKKVKTQWLKSAAFT